MLDTIGIKYGTDKSSLHHDYLKYYESHFQDLKDNSLTLMELGIGGYDYIDRGGESLRMWREYFTHARIIGIDIYQKNEIQGVEIYKASQDDEEFLKSFGRPEIVIDDASHVCDLTIKTFEILFPLLNPGGWYVIEDTEGCFFDGWSRGTLDPQDFNYPHPLNLVRKLINAVNSQYIPNFSKTFSVEEIHIYKNIVFIKKR